MVVASFSRLDLCMRFANRILLEKLNIGTFKAKTTRFRGKKNNTVPAVQTPSVPGIAFFTVYTCRPHGGVPMHNGMFRLWAVGCACMVFSIVSVECAGEPCSLASQLLQAHSFAFLAKTLC